MDTALTVLERPELPAELIAPLKLAADFAQASKAPATQAAYGSDFRIFETWCTARGLSALPATAAALCGFLADEATTGRRASTLGAAWPPSGTSTAPPAMTARRAMKP